MGAVFGSLPLVVDCIVLPYVSLCLVDIFDTCEFGMRFVDRVHTSQSHTIPKHIIIQLESKHEEWTKKNPPPKTTLLLNLTRELVMMFTMSQLGCRPRHCICESKSTRSDKHVHVHVSLGRETTWWMSWHSFAVRTRTHVCVYTALHKINHMKKKTTLLFDVWVRSNSSPNLFACEMRYVWNIHHIR